MKTDAPPAHSKILILDFGSQYTQVIARRIRECQVYSEIVRFDIPAAEVTALKPNGIILSGGPASVYDNGVAASRSRDFCAGHSGARNLLRPAIDGASSRRPGRIQRTPRIRRRHAAGVERLRNSSTESASRSTSGTAMATKSPLCRMGSASPAHTENSPFARDRRSGAKALRAAISSRSRAHAAREGDSAELRLSHLRLRDGLDDGLVHRRSLRTRPRDKSATRRSCSA